MPCWRLSCAASLALCRGVTKERLCIAGGGWWARSWWSRCWGCCSRAARRVRCSAHHRPPLPVRCLPCFRCRVARVRLARAFGSACSPDCWLLCSLAHCRLRCGAAAAERGPLRAAGPARAGRLSARTCTIRLPKCLSVLHLLVGCCEAGCVIPSANVYRCLICGGRCLTLLGSSCVVVVASTLPWSSSRVSPHFALTLS